MSLFNIHDQLAITNHLVGYVQGAAWAFLAALGVLTLSFSFVRAALLGSLQDPVAWGLRFLVVVGCLSAYGEIVDGLIAASKNLTEVFVDKAGYDEYARHIVAQFQPMLEDPDVQRVASAGVDGDRPPEPSTLDRVVGMLRGGVLTTVVSVAYYLQFMAFEFITKLAIVFISILRIMGPLMIAAGVLGDGKSLKQWLSSFIQVLLWPVVPPLFMMVVVGSSGLATQTDNVAFVIQQALILAMFSLATPLIVSFIMGRGGVAAGAAAVIGAGVSAIKMAVPAVAGSMGVGQRWVGENLDSSGNRITSPTGGATQRPGEGHAPSRGEQTLLRPKARQQSSGGDERANAVAPQRRSGNDSHQSSPGAVHASAQVSGQSGTRPSDGAQGRPAAGVAVRAAMPAEVHDSPRQPHVAAVETPRVSQRRPGATPREPSGVSERRDLRRLAPVDDNSAV